MRSLKKSARAAAVCVVLLLALLCAPAEASSRDDSCTNRAQWQDKPSGWCFMVAFIVLGIGVAVKLGVIAGQGKAMIESMENEYLGWLKQLFMCGDRSSGEVLLGTYRLCSIVFAAFYIPAVWYMEDYDVGSTKSDISHKTVTAFLTLTALFQAVGAFLAQPGYKGINTESFTKISTVLLVAGWVLQPVALASTREDESWQTYNWLAALAALQPWALYMHGSILHHQDSDISIPAKAFCMLGATVCSLVGLGFAAVSVLRRPCIV